jgi:cytochrome c oxidase cbb3-type subunit 3
MTEFRTIPRRRRRIVTAAIVVALCVGGGAGFILWRAHRATMERRLMAIAPNDDHLPPDLVSFARRTADPVFAANCAECHGADMKGRVETGAPNLTDANWLYRRSLFDIERVILYGLRSGHSKGIDVTEMPAFGQRGQMTPEEIDDAVQYVLQLSRRPFEVGAAERGQALFLQRCADCHDTGGEGNPDYGTPDLTANAWDYGGTPAQIRDSIYYGRHGVMPAFYGKLTLPQIRALVVTLHASAKN